MCVAIESGSAEAMVLDTKLEAETTALSCFRFCSCCACVLSRDSETVSLTSAETLDACADGEAVAGPSLPDVPFGAGTI